MVSACFSWSFSSPLRAFESKSTAVVRAGPTDHSQKFRHTLTIFRTRIDAIEAVWTIVSFWPTYLTQLPRVNILGVVFEKSVQKKEKLYRSWYVTLLGILLLMGWPRRLRWP